MRRWVDTPRKRVIVVALVSWLLVLSAMEFISVPYVRLSPGPLFNVLAESDGKPIISIDGAEVFPVTGQLEMTTVSERGGPYGDLTLFEAFTGWIDPSVAVVPTSLLYPPDTSGDAARQAGSDQFSDSQEQARIAALQEVGEPVETRPLILEVSPDSPAEGILEHGDVVLAAQGRAVRSPQRLARIIAAAGPSADVVLDVRRGDEDLSVTVVTVANPDDPQKGFLGVTLGIVADSPVTVDFNLDDVGGPSAGLIFSLGIVDKLTPGDLVGGRKVAGTGTMDFDGRVGPIGGIAQKLAAAHDDGVTLFLAPKDNCDEVLGATPPGLEVAAVESLSEARQALEGDLPPPPCPVG
ncbi:MAG: PDZ domain-containing protein [Micrococcales bacterium]|nr:PDZ domain-containing protein [Micrococcales bacterium]